jgi:hypothetical protein
VLLLDDELPPFDPQAARKEGPRIAAAAAAAPPPMKRRRLVRLDARRVSRRGSISLDMRDLS